MNQRMLFRRFHPLEKVAHQLWHTISRRSHVKTVAIPIKYAYTLLTVVSCLFHQVFHYQSMSLQQILFLEGIQFWHQAIGFNSILHFLYLVRSAQYTLSIDDMPQN